MKKFNLFALAALAVLSQSCKTEEEACGPVPTQDQIDLQDMETYAFIHYSLNTYTGQEWGYGNESVELFNPDSLDVTQWVETCKNAGMKGIIFTAKHHSGFCMWPSEYTEYSVKNTPWKDGKGDVVGELAEACKKAGLKFAVYLSPWDRNHAQYGYPEYVTYFRNQLHELLTNYGDMFEVWFDGANGGNGWYGGADETRQIDRMTYYQWDETYDMIRELQPHCVIWNSGANRRGDLRWVGTEAGYVGSTNWSLMKSDEQPQRTDLHHGIEDGDIWCPGETNTSIRPGWFYHPYEDSRVKSLSKLMDTYYKSVGRNSTLLLNIPVMPNGKMSPIDSVRGAAFAKMVDQIFSNNLAKGAKPKVKGDTVFTLSLREPVTFNRFMASEDISKGQRVKKFSLEYEDADGNWQPLQDELVDDGDGLTTIGRKRIICFPEVTAKKVRMTITDAKCKPLITHMGLYYAPKITSDIEGSGEKKSTSYNIAMIKTPNPSIMIEMDQNKKVKGLRYRPSQTQDAEGIITQYSIWAMVGDKWVKQAEGEFSNIINNPIWQTVEFPEVTTKLLRLDAEKLNKGEIISYDDLEVIQ